MKLQGEAEKIFWLTLYFAGKESKSVGRVWTGEKGIRMKQA